MDFVFGARGTLINRFYLNVLIKGSRSAKTKAKDNSRKDEICHKNIPNCIYVQVHISLFTKVICENLHHTCVSDAADSLIFKMYSTTKILREIYMYIFKKINCQLEKCVGTLNAHNIYQLSKNHKINF